MNMVILMKVEMECVLPLIAKNKRRQPLLSSLNLITKLISDHECHLHDYELRL